MKKKLKQIEFPVKLSFMYFKQKPVKEIIVNSYLVTGDKKYGNYFYLILDKNNSLLDKFKTASEVYAFYDSSATFKYINKIINCKNYVSLKFEIVYNKFAKRA